MKSTTRTTSSLILLSLLLLNINIMFVKSFTHTITRSSINSRLASASIQQRTSIGSVHRQQQQSSSSSLIHHHTRSSDDTTRRWMSSSSPSDEQTSVVDTCRTKIMKALETEDVKVLGECIMYVFVANHHLCTCLP